MSRISKRLYRHISQSVCPWNVKFSRELAEDSPFRAREFISGKDAVTLARDILALDQAAFSAAFRKSPMKRAKLTGLKRNAAVVLGNVTQSGNTGELLATLSDPAAALWSQSVLALETHSASLAVSVLRERLAVEPDEGVRAMLLTVLDRLTR